LLATDFGYDPRKTKDMIALPNSFKSVGLEFDNKTWLAEGSKYELIDLMQRKGYRVSLNGEFPVETYGGKRGSMGKFTSIPDEKGSDQ
jgi:hypothetical protein